MHRKNLIFIIFILGMFLALVKNVQAETITAYNVVNISAGTTAAEFQSAIGTELTQDTLVNIAAGTYEWNTSISVNTAGYNLKIVGAGIGLTIIKDTRVRTGITYGTTRPLRFIITGDTIFRMTGIEFARELRYFERDGFVSFATDKGLEHSFRMDHCKISYTYNYPNQPAECLTFSSPFNQLNGVVDHCEFVNAKFYMYGFYGISNANNTPVGTASQDLIWLTKDYFGGDKTLFFENNTWINNGFAALDGEYGTKWVARYNNFTNSELVLHGYEGERSTALVEIYKNTFSQNSTVSGSDPIIESRGGTMLVWGNTMTGTCGWVPMPLWVYCACDIEGSSDVCRHYDYDLVGYPGVDQVGRGPGPLITDPITGNPNQQQYMPLFEWDNTWNGADVDFRVHDSNCADVNTYIQQNRDFFDDGVTVIDATTDKYSHPSGYLVNEGLPYYQPYAYPHPFITDCESYPTLCDQNSTCTLGDLDCQDGVTITDIQIAVNVFLGIETDPTKRTRANVDTNNPDITIADIQKLVNIFLNID